MPRPRPLPVPDCVAVSSSLALHTLIAPSLNPSIPSFLPLSDALFELSAAAASLKEASAAALAATLAAAPVNALLAGGAGSNQHIRVPSHGARDDGAEPRSAVAAWAGVLDTAALARASTSSSLASIASSSPLSPTPAISALITAESAAAAAAARSAAEVRASAAALEVPVLGALRPVDVVDSVVPCFHAVSSLSIPVRPRWLGDGDVALAAALGVGASAGAPSVVGAAAPAVSAALSHAIVDIGERAVAMAGSASFAESARFAPDSAHAARSDYFAAMERVRTHAARTAVEFVALDRGQAQLRRRTGAVSSAVAAAFEAASQAAPHPFPAPSLALALAAYFDRPRSLLVIVELAGTSALHSPPHPAVSVSQAKTFTPGASSATAVSRALRQGAVAMVSWLVAQGLVTAQGQHYFVWEDDEDEEDVDEEEEESEDEEEEDDDEAEEEDGAPRCRATGDVDLDRVLRQIAAIGRERTEQLCEVAAASTHPLLTAHARRMRTPQGWVSGGAEETELCWRSGVSREDLRDLAARFPDVLMTVLLPIE